MKEALLSGRVRRKHSEGLEDALNPGFALPLADAAAEAASACPAHVRSTSLPNATLNLVLAVLGAGQLTLPYAMGQLGLALGLTCLLIFTLLSMHSLKTLTLYELHFTPSTCLETYAELVIRVLGAPGRVICNALLVMYAWGGAVAFLVILKGESEFLWCNYYDCQHHPQYQQWRVRILGDVVASSGQVILLLLALFVLWPLSSLQDLCFMKRFSWLGCAAALIITGVTCWTEGSIPRLEEVMRKDLAAPLEQTSALKVAASLPLLSFSLNSSWAFIPILCTLKDRTQGYTNGLICGSNLLIFVNYLLLCIFGYCLVDDPADIKPNILENLGRRGDGGGGGLVLFAKASLCLQLTLALPLRFFVARKTLLGDATAGCARCLVAFVLVFSATLLALPEISLALVLGLTSSVCASMIIYILPAIIDLKLQLPGVWRKVASLVSFLVGAYILVAGVYANIVGAAVGS